MKTWIMGLAALGVAIGAASSAVGETVATVDGRTITRADLEKQMRSKLIELDNERYEALKEGLDQMIAEEMITKEAKAQSLAPEALIKKEITDKVKAPSDEVVKKFYDDNTEAVQGQPLDAVKPQIVNYLQQQEMGQRQASYLDELKKKYKPSITLPAPVIEVSTEGRPEKGPKNAPVTIIEFSDYECPFCKRAEPAIAKIMQNYADKVRLVFRHFPLPMHKNAQPAAEASACAAAQGKFWEYHAKVFESSDLGTDRLKAIAGEVKLDKAKFDECVDKRQFKADVERDLADGSDAGVNGTPAFFINGRLLSGAQPYEKIKEVVDQELAKKAAPKS